MSSWHPDIFGPHGSAVWHKAVDETIAGFEGAVPATRPLAGKTTRLTVDGVEIRARRITTRASELIISADEGVPVAVIHSSGLELPALSTADWALWRSIKIPPSPERLSRQGQQL